MQYRPTIFPDIMNARWEVVDLGRLAASEFSENEGKNPLLDPEFCASWVNGIARQMGADYTWGGHFEDRKALWRGYYADAQAVTHLGVDYNVPAGTRVCVPRDCVVVHSWADTSTDNGWGGRLLFKMSEAWNGADYLIYGHLAHANLPPEGACFVKGDVIGITGIPAENGGWFPHLHVQCASELFVNAHVADLKLLDGYYVAPGQPHDLAPCPSLLVGHYAT